MKNERKYQVTTPAGSMHRFHIPVMGTGFSIDTPLKVARFGISSVISLVDDVLIEQMRKFHAERLGEPYEPITDRCEDARARRITLYLDLIHRQVEKQVRELRSEPFTPDSGIVRYFELLPDCAARRLYQAMIVEKDPPMKARMQENLRALVVPGSIDVNIITKSDKQNYHGPQEQGPEFSDAMAALRGFALSQLHSSIVFSAGMHPRLYTYLTRFPDFFPDGNGDLKKKVVLKVSDFRSAEIQGKFLAKRGIWVSEYRIESGLNCGGHAFPTRGLLLGPILEQFKNRKRELIERLFPIYNKALAAAGRPEMKKYSAVRTTAQGGIGSSAENDLMLNYYGMDSTGWGTPFLLVPEVTNVDDEHLAKLIAATEDDVFLSDSSPLGPPFWNLRNSDSENARRRRISEGSPGSSCPKGFSVTNTEFSEMPICIASRTYQRLKLKSLDKAGYTSEQLALVSAGVLSKSCICHDLSGGIKVKYGIESSATPAMCCGPNIVNFSRVSTLREMVDHIYGRGPSLTRPGRPHMFLLETILYIDYLRAELEKFDLKLSTRNQEYFADFKRNLLEGIDYYQSLAERFFDEEWNRFRDELDSIRDTVEALAFEPTAAS